MTKEEFIEKYNMPPMPVQRAWSFKSDLDTLLRETAIEQRNRDRAVYSLNRTRTSIEIKDAILKAPLVTSPNIGDKK